MCLSFLYSKLIYYIQSLICKILIKLDIHCLFDFNILNCSSLAHLDLYGNKIGSCVSVRTIWCANSLKSQLQ